MCFLCHLPSDVTANIVFPFLTIRELGRFDIAMTSHVERGMLIEAYRGLNLPHSPSGLDEAQMIWYSNRSISLRSVTLAPGLTQSNITDLFRLLHKQAKDSSSAKIVAVNISHCESSLLQSHYAQMLNACSDCESLDISECPYITKQLLQRIGTRCSNLTSLNLQDCPRISDIGIIALIESTSSHLKYLNLSIHKHVFRSNISDFSVALLGKNCVSLRTLQLHGCSKLTDVSVISIACGCPFLSILNLGCCDLISDEGVTSLAHHCHSLTHIDLHWCNKVTNKAVSQLAEGCRSLKYLDFNYCETLTKDTLDTLFKYCPQLCCVYFH